MTPEIRFRHFTIDARSADAATRTVRASLSSEAPVRRFGSTEVLMHSPESVNLVRARRGLPLLFAHDQKLPVGVVDNIHLDEGARTLVGDLRFGSSPRAAEIFKDVQDGVLQNMSIGYSIDKHQEADDGSIEVTRWTLHEASIVTVPADHTVGIGLSRKGPGMERRDDDNHENQHADDGEQHTDDEASKVVRRDAPKLNTRDQKGIRDRVHSAGFAPAFADELIERGFTFEQACVRIVDEIAKRSPAPAGAAFIDSASNRGDPLQDMTAMLVARCGGPKPPESARRYVNARMVDMARELLEIRGTRTTMLSRDEIFSRSLHSSSDFPNLLTATGNRLLRMGYEQYKGGAKLIAKQVNAPDFRPLNRLNLSEAPALLKVLPGAEITKGTMAESKEAYSLATFARIFGINRQALVNDDLSAFSQLAPKFGRAGAEFECQQIVNLLTANAAMGDGVALFHATHANKAGSPGAISVATLGTAKQAMRLQKGIDTTTPIDVTPRFLLVPAALETIAQQFVAQLTPALPSSVNPFTGTLEVIVDPRLDAVSATAWYMAADPAHIDTLEYAYLQDAPGLYLESRFGFEMEGIEMKARLDFGCGAIDFRGLYLNG